MLSLKLVSYSAEIDISKREVSEVSKIPTLNIVGAEKENAKDAKRHTDDKLVEAGTGFRTE